MMQQLLLDPSVLENIIKHIRDWAERKGNKELLGSQLGAILVPFLKPQRVADFGGTKPFVKSHLSGIVEFSRRTDVRPGDDIFTILGATGSGEVTSKSAGKSKKEVQNVKELPTPLFWNYFTNPANTVSFAVSSDRSELHVFFSDAAASMSPEWTKIAGTTDADLKAWIKEFADEELGSQEKQEIGNMLAAAGYYRKWIALLRMHGTKNLSSKWGKHRISRLTQLLETQLQQAEVSKQSRQQIGDALWASKRNQSSQPEKDARPPSVQRPASVQFPSSDELEIARVLARKAIDSMTLDELKAIRVSLGAVLSTIKK